MLIPCWVTEFSSYVQDTTQDSPPRKHICSKTHSKAAQYTELIEQRQLWEKAFDFPNSLPQQCLTHIIGPIGARAEGAKATRAIRAKKNLDIQRRWSEVECWGHTSLILIFGRLEINLAAATLARVWIFSPVETPCSCFELCVTWQGHCGSMRK